MTLKATGTGALRAMHAWSGLGPPLERYPLSADCGCCEIFPDGTPVTYRVDLGEQTTITGSGAAHYYSHFTEGHGAFHERYQPTIVVNGGGVVSFTARLLPPHQISTPPGFTDDGAGENANWVVSIDWAFGDQSGTEYFEKGSSEPTERDVTWSFSYPARLFAANRELSRFNGNSTLWGPRPRSAHPEDAWDVRGYKTADVDWYYWSPDGAGSLSITAWGETFTASGGGVPIVVQAGSCSLDNGDSTVNSGEECWLEGDFFGSRSAPATSGTVYADDPANTDGGTAWTSGDGRISSQRIGSSSTYRKILLQLTNMQPDRVATFSAECLDAEGASWSAGTFDVDPLDGPDWTAYSIPTTVNTEYPVGTALAMTAPGTQALTGEAYGASAGGWVGAFGGTLEPLTIDVDTIGTPAFGFQYDGADLAANGQKQDAWRFGLQLPGNYSSWEAIRIAGRPDYYLETFDAGVSGWAAGAGTTLGNDGGSLHLSGAGAVSATKAYAAGDGVGTFRYTGIRARTASGASTLSVVIGSKQWDFTPSAAGSTLLLDSLAPTNASGVGSVSTKQEARGGSTDWSWGIEPGETWEIHCSEECWIDWILADGRGEETVAIVGEAIYQNATEFFEQTVTEGVETLDLYLHRELLFIQEGRIVYDEECGRVSSGTTDYNGQKVHDIRTIQGLISLAMSRTASAGLARMISLKPPAGGLTAGWDGAWLYYKPEHYFTNQVEAYMLRPGVSYGTQGVELRIRADYQVDRIAPGVGVSYTYTHRKLVGGGFHGVVLDSGASPVSATVATAENSDSTTSGSNGAYILPEAAVVDVETPQVYTFGPSFDGSPSASTLHGVSRRRGLIQS